MKLTQKTLKALDLAFQSPTLFAKYARSHLQRQTKEWKKTRKETALISIGQVRFEVDFSFLGNNDFTRQMVTQTYQISTIEAMKALLRPGDLFVDIGANVGYLSAVGAFLVGPSGQVHAFEPIPIYYEKLTRLATLNPDYSFYFVNAAAGDKNERKMIDCVMPPYSGGSSIVEGFIPCHIPRERIEISVQRLDEYLFEHRINPTLIKIDVEGYEYFTLIGLEKYLNSTAKRPALIVEIAPSAFKLTGFGPDDVQSFLRRYGYESFSIWNPHRKFDLQKIGCDGAEDVLFRVP